MMHLAINSVIPLQWIKLLNLFFSTWKSLVHPLIVLLTLIFDEHIFIMFCNLNSAYFLLDTMESHQEERIFFFLWCGICVVPGILLAARKQIHYKFSFLNCCLGLLLGFSCRNRCNATLIRNQPFRSFGNRKNHAIF